MKTSAMREISHYRIICKGGQILLLRFEAMPKFRIQKTSLDKILSTTFRVFKGSSVAKTQTNRYQCHYGKPDIKDEVGTTKSGDENPALILHCLLHCSR